MMRRQRCQFASRQSPDSLADVDDGSSNGGDSRRLASDPAVFATDGGSFDVPFFNQPWMKKNVTVGDVRTLEGVLQQKGRRFVLQQARRHGTLTLAGARGRKLDHVIELNVDEDALVERITGRFTCANCGKGYHDKFEQPRVPGTCDKCGSHEFKRRPDDNEETVRTRMAEYRAKTAPILPIYEARGIVSKVDGMANIDHVNGAIEAILGS
mgnify:CR=1 FL=1